MSAGVLNSHVIDFTREQLFRLLLQLSFKKQTGGFVLASGRQSDFYVDVRQTALTGEGAILIGKLFLHIITRMNREVVGISGLTIGADPLVMATIICGYQIGHPLVDGFLVRKEAKGHGAQGIAAGGMRLAAGSSVAVCDDVITTGASMLRGIEGARSLSFTVPLALAVVDRGEDGGIEAIRGQGVKVIALFTLTELDSGQLQPFTLPR